MSHPAHLMALSLALATGCTQPQLAEPWPQTTVQSTTDWDTPTAFGPTLRDLVAGLNVPTQLAVDWAPGAPPVLSSRWDLELRFDEAASVSVATTTDDHPEPLCLDDTFDDTCVERVEAVNTSVSYRTIAELTWTDPATGLRLTAPCDTGVNHSAMTPTSGGEPLWVFDTFTLFSGAGIPFPEGTTYLPANWQPPASWAPLELPPAVEQSLQAAIAPTARLDTLSWVLSVTYELDPAGAISEVSGSKAEFNVVNTEADPGNGPRLSPLDEVARGTIGFAP